MPTESKTRLTEGMGDECLRSMAVRCLSVAPGKLSAWIFMCVNLGILAMLESPMKMIDFLIGRAHMVALRLVYGWIEGSRRRGVAGWFMSSRGEVERGEEGEDVCWSV